MNRTTTSLKDDACPWGRAKTNLNGVVLTRYHKHWLGSRVVHEIFTTRELHLRFKIPLRTLQKYAKNVRDGIPLYESGGAPRIYDKQSCDIIKTACRDANYCLEDTVYKELLAEEAILSARRRDAPLMENNGASKSTIKRLETRLYLKSGSGEATTSARAIACEDIRNAVSFAVMNHVMVPLTNPWNIANLDASQFTVGNAKGKLTVWYCTDEDLEEEKKNDTTPPQKCLKIRPKKARGLVSFFIKYYLLIFADGTQAAPIYVVADKMMGDEDFDVYEVMGIGIGTDIGSKGYVVFCKTRCGNKGFYRWLNDHFLLPMVQLKKELYGDDAGDLIWFQLDGEPVQISVYNVPDVLASLKANNIVIGKPSGSTTEITQPCDNSNLFKGPKTSLKNINDSDVMDEVYMLTRLESVVKAHEVKCGTKFPPAHKTMFSRGLLRVHMALQNCMRPRMIKEAFRNCGIWPLDPVKILSNCKTFMTNVEVNHIVQAIPQLAIIMKRRGYLIESDYDKANIRNNTDTNKDNLTMCRQRSCILTAKDLIARETTKRELRAQVAVVAQEKKQEAAAKRRRKADEKAAKAATQTVADTLINPVVTFEGIANIEGSVEHFRGREEMEDMDEQGDWQDAMELNDIEEV